MRFQHLSQRIGIEAINEVLTADTAPGSPSARTREGFGPIQSPLVRVGEDQEARRGEQSGENSEGALHGGFCQITDDAFPYHNSWSSRIIARLGEPRFKVVPFEIDGNVPDIRGQPVHAGFETFLLYLLRDWMVHFEDRDLSGFLQAATAAVEPRTQQHQLAGAAPDRITYQVVDRPRAHHGGTSCVWPSQVEDGIDQFAQYGDMGQASEYTVRGRQHGEGVRIVEEAPHRSLLRLQSPAEGYVLSRLACFSVLHLEPGIMHQLLCYVPRLCVEIGFFPKNFSCDVEIHKNHTIYFQIRHARDKAFGLIHSGPAPDIRYPSERRKPMSERIILGVQVTNRVENVQDVQKILTEFGCNIKTRLGLHEVTESHCSTIGLLLLETCGNEAEVLAMESKLREIKGVTVKKMVFQD